jgi:hypothetical protein
VYLEQQRYWVALLNLQRSWTTDEDALSILPASARDFDAPPDWPRRKAVAYLMNHLDLLRDSWRRLEDGRRLDLDLLNQGLEPLRLSLHDWGDADGLASARRAKTAAGARLETLRVASAGGGPFNAGTRFVRGTVERSLYYFAQYADHRLSDAAYPGRGRDRWQVVATAGPDGDLGILLPGKTAPEP